jgi:pyruvate dehydrogenase E1 component alpha subunit
MATTEQRSASWDARTSDLPLRLLATMHRIRCFEQRTEELYRAGELPGFVHLSIGQEACAAGACAALRTDDYITSTHRGHGHCIAKGADPRTMMAELFGKANGVCKGKGGSMHIADFSVGMLGANGVVGGGANLAVGATLAARLRASDQVALSFFGDGASNRGPVHEACNLAAIWKLPVIFFCENNHYASTTAASYALSVENIADRAASYGIPGVVVDGNDALAVYEVTCQAVERARGGGGPTLIEAKTYRLKGHYVGDPEQYRPREEVLVAGERDPIDRLERYVLANGLASDADLVALRQAAHDEIEAAVDFGRAGPLPRPEEALNDIYAGRPA